MSVPMPQRGFPAHEPPSGSATRRTALELARIYVSSSAFNSALEALDRLPANAWDEESRLLRVEALLGLGRVPEADALLGPALLPFDDGKDEAKAQGEGAASGKQTPGQDAVSRPLFAKGQARPARRRLVSRRERISLWRFLLNLRVLHRSGRYREVLQLGRAFFGAKQHPPTVMLARIATVTAQATLALRKPADARDMYEDVFELYKTLRSREGMADALLGMANTQLLDCCWDEADALYQEARFRYEEAGQSDKALACLINLGVLRAKRGDLQSGRALLSLALTRAGQMGEQKRLPSILLGLAMVSMRSGNRREAARSCLQVLRLARQMRSPRARGLAFEYLGELYLYDRRPSRARRVLHAGLKVARTISPTGDLVFEIKRRLAEAALAERSYDLARTCALESISGAREFGDLYEAAVAERILAAIDEAAGQHCRALDRIKQASASLDRLGETFERARFEILRLRLERRSGRLSVAGTRARLATVRRPFDVVTDSPVMQDALDLRILLDKEEAAAPAEPPRAVPGKSEARARVDAQPGLTTAPRALEPFLERGAVGEPTSQDASPLTLSEEDLALARALGLLGTTSEFVDALALARLAAPAPANILILGEAGTGKGQLARLIHIWSRRPGTFFTFRCADLDDRILSAELFGDAGTVGVLGAAVHGTIFFDEVTELPAATQVRLASWLSDRRGTTEEGRIRVVGGYCGGGGCGEGGRRAALEHVLPRTRPLPAEGRLRRELGSVTIILPALRQRPADIPLLVDHFADQTRRRFGLESRPLPAGLAEHFARQEWPGNLRELRGAVEKAVLALEE